MNEPVWTGTVSLRWATDEWGYADRMLLVGRIEAGSVELKRSRFEGLGGWLAWICTHADSKRLGRYATEAEAKAALLAVVIEELQK